MALLFNWPRQSPYLSQLRKAKQKSGSSLDKESPHRNKPMLTRTQSAPEFNVPRELCQTYSARMDRAALAMGVCPGCKKQLIEEHDSPSRISECKNMRHFTCPTCNSEYDVHRPGDECTCPHLQHNHPHHNHHPHRRPGSRSNTSPVHHSHAHTPAPFPPPAPTSSPSSSPLTSSASSAAGSHQTHRSHHHQLQHQHTTGHAPPAARPAMKRRPFQKAYSIDVKDIYNMPPQPKPPSND